MSKPMIVCHNIWLLCWCCFHDESLMHAVNFIVFDHFPWSNFSVLPCAFGYFGEKKNIANRTQATANTTNVTTDNETFDEQRVQPIYSITFNNLHNFLSLRFFFPSVAYIVRFRIILVSIFFSLDIWISVFLCRYDFVIVTVCWLTWFVSLDFFFSFYSHFVWFTCAYAYSNAYLNGTESIDKQHIQTKLSN